MGRPVRGMVDPEPDPIGPEPPFRPPRRGLSKRSPSKTNEVRPARTPAPEAPWTSSAGPSPFEDNRMQSFTTGAAVRAAVADPALDPQLRALLAAVET